MARLRARGERGAALVEFALVFPVMMIVVLGMFSLGQFLNNDLQLTNAVGIGGQVLAVDRGNTLNPCSDAFAAITNAAPLLDPSQMIFTFVLNGTTYGPLTGGSSHVSCSSSSNSTGAAGNLVQGKSASITVLYPCTLMVYTSVNLVPGCLLPGQITEIVQ